MTDEEYKKFLEEYGDIETYIGEEVEKYKKETTELMDAVKLLVFVSLLNKVSKKEFKKKLEKNFKEYKNKIDKHTEKSYKTIVDLTNYVNKGNYTKQDKTTLESALKSLLNEFDIKSTKTQDDKYIRTIENFYSKTKKTTTKDWVKVNEYLSDKVSKFDKVEKTIAYYNKDGSIRAYFDIASYESMVYNSNLTNTGVRQVIKDATRRNYDVVYIDPHAFACPMCQQYQGYFYSLTGLTTEFNGIPIRKLEDVSFWNKGYGLFHPNCKHIPRKAYEDDEVNTKYNSEKWEERYDDKQKINGLELKKQRIRNDMKVYKELGNEEMVDKSRQQINAINRKIRDAKNSIQGIKTNEYEEYKERQKALKEIAKQKEKEKLAKEKAIKKELQRQSSQTHKEMQELFKIRENRPKYIEQLENKQQELKEVRKIISKNQKDMKYWEAKQRELSLKVDIKNLKELINK